jgi:hypothetical protein
MPYLVAAEADKIQDFIFRSSRLREVVGASQLLTRFCSSVEDTLAPEFKGQIVVNDGGSFRVIFDTEADAVAFGADLAELYRLALGGSLTVAEPVKLNGDFRKANDEAGRKLRWAKSRRHGAVADTHMAYVAFCASCGVALAERHGQMKSRINSPRANYLCETCQAKATERDRKPRAILDDFYAAYRGALGSDLAVDRDWPEDADEVARFDLRQHNYVAYLVADGNGMGKLFRRLDQQQIERFSEGLTPALHRSLALPAADFRRTVPGQTDMVPLLPLILGGDDLFALIPAPYALDFARRFCLAWEDELRQLVERSGLIVGKEENGGIPRPTVAAAVVICKSKYPYALAHRRAEALLKEAKRQSKLLAAETGEHLSSVNFEVIVGNRLAGLEDEDEQSANAVRLTLRPYWVARDSLSVTAQGRGIDLEQLLAQRLKLKDVPNKRLAELRRRFEDLPANLTVNNRAQEMENWTNRKLGRVLSRLSKASRRDVEASLQTLGKPANDGDGAHHWREIKRGDASPWAHGMLDLLEAWDFAQDLDLGPDKYEAKEEDE